ncbi:hypothetical protein KUTeg_016190 [Tegillarca granosa]|uniref:Serine/threonine-protein kinase PLK n=1 Tax=Tegillarca granosa TaxID=220873 RepID=A0ABQ9EKD7_TEGGR|nr:hypothetical protein KUTeg_016190 [Tegillarca granosa]
MSVDVLPPKLTQGPVFQYPAHIHQMKETRSTQVEICQPRRSSIPDNANMKLHINHFDPNYIIYDSSSDTTYLRGRLLGKGGFARCYELLDLNTNKIYAGKIIAKTRISKPHQRQKIIREVELQKTLHHKHVVEFHSYFEDDENVYIVLENCSRKSLVHMLKQRKTLTEPEVRYYLKALVEGVGHIHKHNIIHRDLKLGNMLINDSMELKIADFGLATSIGYEGEKKMTVCGTPNYIAPEVLQKRGHSYEADVWAIGCVAYALLVGRPPFETSTLKETYVRITSNNYVLPPTLSADAQDFIQKCLCNEPELRPSLEQLLNSDFLTSGHMPKTLSPACCSTMPKFPIYTKFNRPKSYAVSDQKHDPIEKIIVPFKKVDIQTSVESTKVDKAVEVAERATSPAAFPPIKSPIRELERIDRSESPPSNSREHSPKPRSAATLLDVLSTCLDHMPKDSEHNPPSQGDSNIVWVTKWVDYSNKYGFGFQLSNDIIGVLFNDTSRIILSPDNRAVQYYDMTSKLSTFTLECVPEELEKKTTLLLYFARYMDEHLIQVNFFDDHTKVIMNYMRNDYFVTYIDEDRSASTYSMVNLIQDGCRKGIMERMTFARSMLKNLVDIEGADI